MAEFKKLPTQAELQQMLYMGQLQGKSNEDIINENLARGTTIKVLPESFFTTAGAGARQAGQFVNRAGTAQDLAKLFPGFTGQTTIPIPARFNFAGKMDPSTGQVIPGGLQTQQIPYGDILKAIKPADILGLTGTAQAYSDIGAGKAPSPMDVLDVAGLGAAELAAGKGLLKAGLQTGKFVAPKVGQMAEQYAANTGLLSPLIAYHGSPHSFEKFDISKVGTGEGAQAYGHGIYFAEAPGVARGYQMALGQKAGETTTIGGKPVEQLYEAIQNKANKLPIKEAQIEYDKAAMLEKMMLDTPPDELISYAKDIGADPKVIKWLETDIAPKTKFPGSFYKVDIPDKSIDTFMDWDKPLKDQPEVLKKIRSTIDDKDLLKSFDFNVDKGISGGNAYSSWVTGKLPKDKSELLNKVGIEGIKYLDQGSRSIGEGTKNFVVFDPNTIKVLEKNNKSTVPVKETTADLVSKARSAYEQNPNNPELWKEYLRLRNIRDSESTQGLLGKAGQLSPAVPETMYHGTASDIQAFRPGNTVYVTPSPKFAESYAGTQSPNIMPLRANVANPFNYESAADIQKLAESYKKLHGEDLFSKKTISSAGGEMKLSQLDKNPISQRLKSGDWTIIEDKKVQDAIKKAGFDAFYIEEGGVKNLGVYDPTKLKSVFSSGGLLGTETKKVKK